VRISGPDGAAKVSGPRFRAIVGAGTVRSTRFATEDRGDRIVFRGAGWGHAVGLCQYGARGMAALGHDAEAILRRYYPGAEIVRLYGAS
jgi:stage II sporulation protein D